MVGGSSQVFNACEKKFRTRLRNYRGINFLGLKFLLRIKIQSC